MKIINKILNIVILTLLKFYQACISPMFPGCCRFRPTCSEYAVQAFSKFDFITALVLTIKRLSKCHPFGKKGYDPIPEHYSLHKHCKCKNK